MEEKYLFSSHGRKFYFNLEDLYAAHRILMQKEDSFKVIEWPFSDSSRYPTSGLVEAVLRCKFNDDVSFAPSLQRAYLKLLSRYGHSAKYDVSITFNYVLCGEVADGKFFFYLIYIIYYYIYY